MVRRLVQIRGQLDGSSGSPLLDPERDAERRRRLRSEMEDLRRDLDELRVSLEDASG
jgi:hypothetical protein